MNTRILFVTPPFTQLNTPYPATAYLKGFLNTKGLESYQADLGIEVMLKLFSREGLTRLFESLDGFEGEFSENISRIFHMQDYYLNTIDDVLSFLQNKNPTLAYQICERDYLPEARRFEQVEDLEWAFGTLGIHDKARHFATLYLEDIADLIKETIDPHFGFSRYAEKLALAAVSFDPIYENLNRPNSLVNILLEEILEEKIKEYQPDVFCMSIPFPGNLLSGLKCGQYLRKNHSKIKIVLGGGYANTELRSLREARIFEFVDYICLDDGEASLWHLLEYLDGNRDISMLKRCFSLIDNEVVYHNGTLEKDIAHSDVGTPDYEGLPLGNYLSVIEVANPMHRLWSDGRWNKLTLAHGCYWGKCTFCDVSLDYIKNYQGTTSAILCDRIESIVAQTGETGFHFVDEAAPPALMRDLAIELLSRKINISWWTNIRFEKSFTEGLCQLLKASGCIAVSGGLEVASDRLLEKINKGVTISQVARVADNFTKSGIMVHAYLMYGFPTQTAIETVNSLEVVRQLFQSGLIQSGFWHRFSMTAHSPIGLDPSSFGAVNIYPEKNAFANNDLIHDDTTGCDHSVFGEGLRRSLHNYMHGIGLEYPLQDWFETVVPHATISPEFIDLAISTAHDSNYRSSTKIVWLGNFPEVQYFEQIEEGLIIEMVHLSFYNKSKSLSLEMSKELGEWFLHLFDRMDQEGFISYSNLETLANEANINLGELMESTIWVELRINGLVLL